MDIQLSKTISKIKLNDLPEKSRNAWGEAVLILVIIILGSWFVVNPKRIAVNAKSGQLESLKSKLGDLQQNVDALSGLVSQLGTQTQQVAQLDEALPLQGRSVELQLLLQNLAASSGLAVNDINISDDGTGVAAGNLSLLANPYGAQRSLQQMKAAVTVAGNFENLEAFMKKLETSGRILDINSFQISPGGGSLNSPAGMDSAGNKTASAPAGSDLTMSLNLNAYYFGNASGNN